MLTDVNANQLFKWRREMTSEQPAADESVAMLPVEIVQPVELALNPRNCVASTPRNGSRFAVAAVASGRSAPGHR
jgi:hypothetical protein